MVHPHQKVQTAHGQKRKFGSWQEKMCSSMWSQCAQMMKNKLKASTDHNTMHDEEDL